MEYELDLRYSQRNAWIIGGDICRWCPDIAIPCLSCKRDLSEAQTQITAAAMTCIMVPFQIDLCGCEHVTGLVVDLHFHHIIFNGQRAMRYTGQA